LTLSEPTSTRSKLNPSRVWREISGTSPRGVHQDGHSSKTSGPASTQESSSLGKAELLFAPSNDETPQLLSRSYRRDLETSCGPQKRGPLTISIDTSFWRRSVRAALFETQPRRTCPTQCAFIRGDRPRQSYLDATDDDSFWIERARRSGRGRRRRR